MCGRLASLVKAQLPIDRLRRCRLSCDQRRRAIGDAEPEQLHELAGEVLVGNRLLAAHDVEERHHRGAGTSAALTGARSGELLALTWEDVDLDAGQTTSAAPRRGHAPARIARPAFKGARFNAPKTKSSGEGHLDEHDAHGRREHGVAGAANGRGLRDDTEALRPLAPHRRRVADAEDLPRSPGRLCPALFPAPTTSKKTLTNRSVGSARRGLESLRFAEGEGESVGFSWFPH